MEAVLERYMFVRFARAWADSEGAKVGLWSCLCNMHMGGCQNYGPFWDPYYNTAPNI